MEKNIHSGSQETGRDIDVRVDTLPSDVQLTKKQEDFMLLRDGE